MCKIFIIHGAFNREKFYNFICLPQRTIGNEIGFEYTRSSIFRVGFISTVPLNRSFSENSLLLTLKMKQK